MKTAILASVIVILFQLSSCSNVTSTKVSKPETQASEMPVGIQELQSFTRIILPKSYLEQFLTSTGYKGKVRLNPEQPLREVKTVYLPQKLWWKPDNAKNCLSGRINQQNQGRLWQSQILVDLVSEQTVIVYLHVLEIQG
jgi:hypothetical protein